MKKAWIIFSAIFLFFIQTASAEEKIISLQDGDDWISKPSVFMPVYYADNNADVEKIDGYDHAKLLEHWKKHGINKGRKSSPVFHAKFYLKNNPDVAKQFGERNYKAAAHHWYEAGRKEGRPSHPDFKVRIYLEKNPDVAKSVGKNNYLGAIKHYLSTGYREGRTAK